MEEVGDKANVLISALGQSIDGASVPWSGKQRRADWLEQEDDEFHVELWTPEVGWG